MNRILSIFFALALPLAGWAQSNHELDRLVGQTRHEQGMQHAQLSVCVYNLATGKAVYSNQADLSMTPA